MKLRFLACMLAVACTGSTRPPAHRDVPPSPLAVPSLPAQGGLTSPHGGHIAVLAVTADGGAALSGDQLGSVRLWPKLDGSVEPHIVDLPEPTELAIMRAPRGFAIAAIDNVGGLTLQIIDARGVRLQRSSHPADPAFEGVVASAHGMIAWRSDHSIVRFSDDGAIAAQLAAGRSERVRAIAAAGEHAVAVLEDEHGVLRVRRLELGPALAWGPVVPLAEPLYGSEVVLSPDGARIAATRPLAQGGLSNIDVFDLASGARILAHPIRGDLSIGFATNTLLAAVFAHRVLWLDLEHSERGSSANGEELNNRDILNDVLVAAGGIAISASNNELRISRRTEDRFLGYRFTEAYRAAAGPRGELVIPAKERAIVVGGDLRELRELDRTTLGTNPGDILVPLVWLGEDTWLVQDVDSVAQKTRGRLVDLAKSRATEVFAAFAPREVRFESSTGLVTIVGGGAYEILKLDRAAGKLVPVDEGEFPRLSGRLTIVPVAPDLAMGAQIVVVTNEGRDTNMKWCTKPTELERCKQGTAEGYPVAFARSGHVMVYEAYERHATATFLQGKRVGETLADELGSRWPSPDGSAYVLAAEREVVMVGLDGVVKWRRALGGIHSALWASDGTIVLLSGYGMARLDARTGEPIAARCGWRFELSTVPHDSIGDREPLCTQL